MSSLGLMSNAIESGETGRILDAVEGGVSANLCEALTTMKPPGDQDSLEIGVSWARVRPPRAVDVPARVTFVEENFAVIQEAGRKLRTRARPERQQFKGQGDRSPGGATDALRGCRRANHRRHRCGRSESASEG